MRHGTPTGWRHHGCRCEDCHRALLAEAKETWAARKLAKGADPATHVDPARMLRHLDRLAVCGLSANEVANRAGVSASTLSRARRTGSQVSRIVEEQVLAVRATYMADGYSP